ncbi:MAG: histidine phosphatase family protein [Planctomycetota bacterium]|nr:histidine phosphatase family protein [Planctomycetota bacterium]MDG1985259.1 histidine phosphatase family protein [Planctomycetota bacterium]
MIELMLVRHGNTFAPGDRIVWVGSGEDLPLVPSGRAQARLLGDALSAAKWTATAALSGGLKRQAEHLRLATGGTPAPIVHRALNEVDYGDWGGRTTDEIVAAHGDAAVRGWNERSQWPADAGWPETLEAVRARVGEFAEEVASGQHGDRVLVCSSNGLLRWFLGLVPGALEAAIEGSSFKVKTGHVGRMEWRDGEGWQVASWNQPPTASVH